MAKKKVETSTKPTKKAKATKPTKKAKVTRRPKATRPESYAPTQRNEVPASRCPKCGSTERTPYSNTITKSITGIDDTGQMYNTVKWRTTFCANPSCGQRRVDRTTLLEEVKRKVKGTKASG